MTPEATEYLAALRRCEKELAGIDDEIAKIEERRAKLLQTRELLRDLAGVGQQFSYPADVVFNEPEEITPFIRSDAFKGLSIVEAAKKYLRIMKVGRSTGDIAAALLKGGYETSSKNFYDTVRSVLRDNKAPKGAFLWRDNKWELAEWHEQKESA